MLQVAAARGGYGGERYEKLEFQKKVEQKFKSLKDSAWQVLCRVLRIVDVTCLAASVMYASSLLLVP